MNAPNRTLRIALAGLALAACSSGTKKPTPETPPTHVRLSGQVAACVFDGAAGCTVEPSTSPQSGLEGRVIVAALDSNWNVYQGGTLDDGGFSVQVPAGLSYVVLFRDSAGQFLATLILNGAGGGAQALSVASAAVAAGGTGTALTAKSDLDLGVVKIDKLAREAKSTNETLLVANADASGPTLASLSDVTYTAATSRASFSMYSPFVNGRVNVRMKSQFPLVEKLTSEYDPTLGRDVFVEWRYQCGDASCSTVPALDEKGIFYLTDSEICMDRQIDAAGQIPKHMCAYDVAEVGVRYTIGQSPYTFSFEILSVESSIVFPDFDGASRPAFVMWAQEEGQPEKYTWYGKGLGEMLYLRGSPEVPTVAGEPAVQGQTVDMRLLCQLTPDSLGGHAVAGSCPAGVLANGFVESLPTTFPPQ